MNRRSFLSSLAVFSAAVVLDPERILWVPGAKKIFVPSNLPPRWYFKNAIYQSELLDLEEWRKIPYPHFDTVLSYPHIDTVLFYIGVGNDNFVYRRLSNGHNFV